MTPQRTFHPDLHDLHGTTVVVHTHSPTLYVGRCHDLTPQSITLLDGDAHTDSPHTPSRDQYLKQAAKWGVFKSFDRLEIPATQIKSITPLNHIRPD